MLGNDLAACDAYKNAVADAEKVTCPTLFVTADRDQMTPPKVSVPLAAAIAGSRTVQLSGAGHLMMIEKPDEALDALISAL